MAECLKSFLQQSDQTSQLTCHSHEVHSPAEDLHLQASSHQRDQEAQVSVLMPVLMYNV